MLSMSCHHVPNTEHVVVETLVLQRLNFGKCCFRLSGNAGYVKQRVQASVRFGRRFALAPPFQTMSG